MVRFGMKDSSRLGPKMFMVSVAGSVLLIAMGLFFALDHHEASHAYGIDLAGGPDNAWISSTALRDLAYGCVTLIFTVLRDRRAVGICLLCGAIIPLGDAVVVIRHSPTPLEYLPLHLGGIAICLALAFILLRPTKTLA
jgi:hypothetical protein